jgi:hypothetical protein
MRALCSSRPTLPGSYRRPRRGNTQLTSASAREPTAERPRCSLSSAVFPELSGRGVAIATCGPDKSRECGFSRLSRAVTRGPRRAITTLSPLNPAGTPPEATEAFVKSTTLAALLAAHKTALAAAAFTAATAAGGGLAIAHGVADSHSNAPTSTVTASSSSDDSQSDSDASKDSSTNSGVTPANCPSGLKNHGQYVSGVAKTKPSPGSSPGAHGAAVSAAAQSDCGKPSPDASSSETESHSPNSHSTSHSPNPHSTASHAPNSHSTSHAPNSHSTSHTPNPHSTGH